MDFTHSHIHSTNHRITDPNGMWSVAKMECQIHCLEIHAYNSLLKAFIAQSEVLTWGKEGLLTQIRKELHIADSEHGEMLMKFNSDETIKQIREQRKMASQSHAQAYHNSNSTGHLSASSENSVIRLEDLPSSAFFPQKNIPHSQASSMPASNICPNGTVLKYNDNLLTVQFVHGKAEPPKEMFNYDAQLSPSGSVPKGNYHNKQPFYSSESPVLNNESNFIRLRSTYTIINGVENMLFNRENPEPVAIEIAKQTLHEQERDLLEAIGKLENVLEDDDDDEAPQNVQDFSGGTSDDCPF